MVPDGSIISIHDGDYVETMPIIITSRVTLQSKSYADEAAVKRRVRLELGESEGAQDAGDAWSVAFAKNGLEDGVGSGVLGIPGSIADGFLLTGVPPTLGGLLAVGVGGGAGMGGGGWIDDVSDEEQGDDAGEGDSASDDSGSEQGGAGVATDAHVEAAAQAFDEVNNAGEDEAASVTQSVEVPVGVPGSPGPQTPHAGAATASGQTAAQSIGRKKGMPKTAVTVRMFNCQSQLIAGSQKSRRDPLLLIAAPLAVVQVCGITWLHLRGRRTASPTEADSEQALAPPLQNVDSAGSHAGAGVPGKSFTHLLY
jgi:hypothetical protein